MIVVGAIFHESGGDMYLGFDSSTQSLSAMLIDAASGSIVCEESVNFGADLPQYDSPSGFIPGGKNGEVHANPLMWVEALDLLLGKLSAKTDLAKVKAIGGSGQQHGSVYVNEKFPLVLSSLDAQKNLLEQIQPTLSRATSPIWMDTSTGAQCAEIAAALGGNAGVCGTSGSVAVERFTGSQIRKFAQENPAAYDDTLRVHLVSSFICSLLAGKEAAIDYGDGAGMNLMNLAERKWDERLVNATAKNLLEKLPALANAGTVVGNIAAYFSNKYGFSPACKVGVFTGDNPASLVGMGATHPGNIVISLGTSDTFFAAMDAAHTDPKGFGHVFGNPAGGYMSLVCFRNGSLAREAMRDALHASWDDFDAKPLSTTPVGNDGNVMLPFYGSEITPRFDFSTPVRKGTPEFEKGEGKESQIRALLEGQFMNMRLHTDWMNVKTNRILLTGGASKNDGIAQIVADVFAAPVERLAIANSAALGAALLAAVADGGDLAALQKIFCKPAEQSKIENQDCADYSSTMKKFSDLLEQVTK